MEARLARLNEELTSVLHDLRTTHTTELSSSQKTPQDPSSLPSPTPNLETSVELLGQASTLLTPPLHTLIDGIFAFTISSALHAAVQYSIPSLLSTHGPLPIPKLASLTAPPLSPSALTQTLQLLASHGIFSYDPATRVMANTPASELLKTEHWTRWELWAKLYPGRFDGIFQRLGASLPEAEGRSAMHIACGAEASEGLYSLLGRQRWAGEFHETLGAGARASAPGLVGGYPWKEVEKLGSLCDLGGGNGELVATLLEANEGLRGLVLEIGKTADFARGNFAEGGKFAGVGSRAEVVEGDFFKEVPQFPVYTCRWTFHNWDDEKAGVILRRAREGLVKVEGARMLIVDAVVTMGRMGRPAMYGSAVMMSGAKGGKERTEDEWRALCEGSGWRVEKIYRLRTCLTCIIDLRPE